MGFLSRAFGRSFDTNPGKLKKAFACYKPEMTKTWMPGGISQADKIIKSLAKIFSLDLATLSSLEYFKLLDIYSAIWVRQHISGSSVQDIKNSLLVNHSDYVNNDNANITIAYAQLNTLNNEFAINSNEELKQAYFLADSFDDRADAVVANKSIKDSGVEKDNYGLSSNAPIYCKEVLGSKAYLARLRTQSNEEIEWTRLGSIGVIGINGRVDKYQGKTKSGQDTAIIYINMYSDKSSTKAPVGFMFI